MIVMLLTTVTTGRRVVRRPLKQVGCNPVRRTLPS
jgi:hypothetical protein